MKSTSLLLLLLVFSAALPCFGQAQGNPFGNPAGNQQPGNQQPGNQQPGQGGNPFGAAAGAAAQPAAGQAAGNQGGTGPATAKPKLVETDLAVLAIKDSNPTTPEALLQAIQSMRNLQRPKLAAEYLQTLMDNNPDDDALVKMHDRFGTGFFRELADDAELKPASEKLLDNVTRAASEFYRDVNRIDAVIRNLNSAQRSSQLAALLDLRKVGRLGVERMLAALADDARKSEHTNIRKAIVAMGDLAIEPTVGALESKDTKLLVQVIHVLGRLKASRSIPFLLKPMFLDQDPLIREMATDSIRRIVGSRPTRKQAEEYLYRRVQAHLSGQLPTEPGPDGRLQLWHWNPQTDTVYSTRYAAETAAKLLAAQTAAQLLPFDENKSEYRMAYMLSRLAAVKLINDIDQPLADFDPEVQALGKLFKVRELEAALAEALERKEIAAAVGAAQVLGHLGTPELVYSKDGRQQVLVAAMKHANPRVQFAATEAILALDPRQSFPGSSGVIESLKNVILTGGSRRIVIGHPLIKRLEDLRGHVAALGFELEVARAGRQLYRSATTQPDVEFVLLSDQIAYPRTIEVYQALRRNPATSGTPIAILSKPDDLLLNQELYKTDPLTAVVVEPHREAGVRKTIQRLQSLPAHGMIPFETRVARARRALLWLSRLAENSRYSFYNLHRLEAAAVRALNALELSREAAKLLGLLGTPKAQQALVDLASHHGQPLALRQAAASAFREAIKRHRVLLTIVAIQRQYQRYNDTERLDRETQIVMGSILDSIELPTKEKQVTDK